MKLDSQTPGDDKKDELLHKLLPLLSARGMVSQWAQRGDPHRALWRECRHLGARPEPLESMRQYLQANPIIQQTVETLLAALLMSTRVPFEEIPPQWEPYSGRGWRIMRWLPTFLIVDGPVGHLVRKYETGRRFTPASPLKALLETEYRTYPILAEIRDALDSKLFGDVRNSFAHWSFQWEDDSIELFSYKTGKPVTTVSALEGDALYLMVYEFVDALDHCVFRVANPPRRWAAP